METLKSTPLEAVHCAAGARMVPFAGWNMPVQYKDGIIAEHRNTREAVSLFDICHMGEFEVSGGSAAAELDRILARPVLDQPVGVCRYNFLLNEQGGVLDDLIVYRLGADDFFIVVNAGTRDSDAAVFTERLADGVEFLDVSDETGKLDLQGPGSVEILEKLGLGRDSLPGYYRWSEARVAGIACLMSRTGYTGELGFEFYVDIDETENLWNVLTDLGAKPAGLGARDTLRLEMGYPLYGHELSTEVTPIEAGFGKMLKLEELPGRVFTGSAALRGVAPRKELVGIRLDGRRAAREGTEVYSHDGANLIGKVTSGAFAPSLECAVAMAYVNVGQVVRGGKVWLRSGKTELCGEIVSMPFFPGGSARIQL